MSIAHDIEKLSLYKAHMEAVSGLQLGNILDDVKTDPKVKACVKATIEATGDSIEALRRAAKLTPWIYTASTMGAGYAGASVVNTNADPSALKTAATGLVSGLGGGLVANVGIGLLMPTALRDAEKACAAAKLRYASVRDEIKMLDDAQTAELLGLLGVTQAQLDVSFSEGLGALGSALGALLLLATLTLTTAIAGAVHGYKRSGGLSALGFFMLGPTGLGMALKQGYGKPLSEVQKKV